MFEFLLKKNQILALKSSRMNKKIKLSSFIVEIVNNYLQTLKLKYLKLCSP